MKRKIIILICQFIFIQSIGFCQNIQNNYQLKEEQKYDTLLKEKINNDKAIAYKALILEDYWTTLYYKEDANHTVFGELYKNIKKYKNNKDSDNYIYTKKTIDLYNGLVKKSSNIMKQNSTEIKLERINIPDEKFSKIDKNVLGNIFFLNVILHNIQD